MMVEIIKMLRGTLMVEIIFNNKLNIILSKKPILFIG